jgi:hypothetical protein
VERFQSINARQPDVEDDQFEDRACEQIEACLAVLDCLDVEAFILENPAEGLPDTGLVVDNEDARSFHDQVAVIL